MKSSFLLSIAALAILPCVSACESGDVDRHASNRALRGPVETSDAENEFLADRGIFPLVEVDMPNGPKGQPTVITAADSILGRQPVIPTELHPTTPPTPVGIGVQLQPTTAPTTAPAATQSTAPVRGNVDSTTEP